MSIIEVLEKTEKAKEEKQNYIKSYHPEKTNNIFCISFYLVKHLHTYINTYDHTIHNMFNNLFFIRYIINMFSYNYYSKSSFQLSVIINSTVF